MSILGSVDGNFFITISLTPGPSPKERGVYTFEDGGLSYLKGL